LFRACREFDALAGPTGDGKLQGTRIWQISQIPRIFSAAAHPPLAVQLQVEVKLQEQHCCQWRSLNGEAVPPIIGEDKAQTGEEGNQ
jgi:hypothetical protein